MHSYQNLIILKNLYLSKQLGFNYLDNVTLNSNTKDSFLPNELPKLEALVKRCMLCDLW